MEREYKSYKKIFKYFWIVLIILNTISLIVLLYREEYTRENKFRELKNIEKNMIRTQSRVISKEIGSIVSDLSFLAQIYSLEEKDKIEVENQWKLFCKNKKIYDQIRYIDKNGEEKIRVNYYCGSNECKCIDSPKLQNKSHRPYVKETLKLDRGQVFISRLDLNIENGMVEEPNKPMIRFSTPIFGKGKNVEGMIVVNYLAQNTLDEFRDISEFSNGKVYLLNEEGYFLYSDREDEQWGFMYEDKKDISFRDKFKKEWDIIEEGKKEIITDKGLFLTSRIKLEETFEFDQRKILDENIILSERSWITVSFIDSKGPFSDMFKNNLSTRVKRVVRKNQLYFINSILIAIIISFLIFVIRSAYLKIKFLSEYDSMTDTLNKSAGLLRFKRDLERHKKHNHGLSLCFIDVNGLKRVNDVLGHNYGDELITTTIDIIKKAIRDSDYIIRVGGDEFIIVFNNISVNQTQIIWERISDEFERINSKEDRRYKISVSHGVVEIDKDENRTVEKLVEVADKRMYEEKRNIKNRYDIIK